MFGILFFLERETKFEMYISLVSTKLQVHFFFKSKQAIELIKTWHIVLSVSGLTTVVYPALDWPKPQVFPMAILTGSLKGRFHVPTNHADEKQ